MPRDLSPAARGAWRSVTAALARLGVLSTADGEALRLLCEALGEYREARRVLDREGVTYDLETKTGGTMHRARPEAAIAADAWRRASAMLGRFGLTPADRARLGGMPEGFRGAGISPDLDRACREAAGD